MAPSTVAMTVYNVLAGLPDSTRAELAKQALLPEADVQAALDALLLRGYVRATSGRFDLLDPKRRLVRWRDRSDAALVVHGVQIGGWNGWMVQCRQRGQMTIEDAIAEGSA